MYSVISYAFYSRCSFVGFYIIIMSLHISFLSIPNFRSKEQISHLTNATNILATFEIIVRTCTSLLNATQDKPLLSLLMIFLSKHFLIL